MSGSRAGLRRRRALLDALPVGLLALAMAVRVWNACVYDLRHQHDVRVHVGYLRELAAGHLPASYNAPWYYLLTCLLAAPAIAAARLAGAGDDALLRLSVGLAGAAMFGALAAGCLALGRALGFAERDARWYAALVCAFPVVARTFNMVRPENLILTLTPWALVWLLRWAPPAAGTAAGARRPAFRALAAAEGLMLAQKVAGVAVVAVLPAFLALRPGRGGWRGRLRAAGLAWGAGAAVAAALVAVQALATGTTPFRHDRADDPRFGAAPGRFLVGFDPASVWREPFRDAHRGSMPEILLIDLHGDYWRAGFDQVTRDRAERARWLRARAGIGISTAFAALWVAAVAAAAWRSRRPGGRPRPDLALTAAALAPLAAAAAYLAAAAQRFYVPDDGDIAKWEYVVWVFVFLPIPLVQAAAGLTGGRAAAARGALAALALAGLVQSVVTDAF